MTSKLYSVRIPVEEVESIDRLFDKFPGASPALIIRALLHSASGIQITNALAKHAADKVRRGRVL